MDRRNTGAGWPTYRATAMVKAHPHCRQRVSGEADLFMVLTRSVRTVSDRTRRLGRLIEHL
jgi:hypothetical protein